MYAPILYESNSISKDASKDFVVTYTWDNAFPQQIGNIITIRKNDTNAIVYTNTQNDFYRYSIIIPARTLTNGVLYKVTVQVKYSAGISSDSESKLFYCYTTPTLSFSNVVDKQQINSSSYQVNLSYWQPEGEELQSYKVGLYNSSKSEIYSTNLRYDTENMSITITSLNDKTQYFFRATGITVTGMEMDTGYVEVAVSYLQPTSYAIVELTNVYEEGYIDIKSNIVTIEGVYVPEKNESVPYLKGRFIDLRGEGYVYYDKGFDMSGDWSIILKGFDFQVNCEILRLSNGQESIRVFYRKGIFEGNTVVYFDVRVDDVPTYYIYSNYLEIPEQKRLIGFCLNRQNHYYDIQATKYEEVVTL